MSAKKTIRVGDPARLSDPLRIAAWRKYPISTLMSIWHLYTGGMREAAHINKAVGLDLHWQTIASIVKGVESLVNGPLILDYAVRCNGCGSPVMSVPCKLCQLNGKLGQGYREIKL